MRGAYQAEPSSGYADRHRDARARPESECPYREHKGPSPVWIIFDPASIRLDGLLPLVQEWVGFGPSRHRGQRMSRGFHVQADQLGSDGETIRDQALQPSDGFVARRPLCTEGERFPTSCPESISGNTLDQNRNPHRSSLPWSRVGPLPHATVSRLEHATHPNAEGAETGETNELGLTIRKASCFRRERFPRPGVDGRWALRLQDFDLGLDRGDGVAGREHLEHRLHHVAAIDGQGDDAVPGLKEGDIGNDGVWDIWKLEGPAFSWYFRGSPHVHTWLNVARRA